MAPYRELFDGIPFEPPQLPVYCCSTGRPFPTDPNEIRNLTVNHWVSPVEFTRMVEALYEDGVRLFVEAGPRGNLSAFTEDILRGRPFAALPANLPRKSGPTQINHLVGQLVVHRVPVNVSHLFAGLETGWVDWEGDRFTPTTPDGGPQAGRSAESDSPESDADRLAALNGYLDVMEQFLDVQRSVMEAFLRGGEAPVPQAAQVGLFEHAFPETLSTPEPTPGFAFLGEIVELEPGRSITTRRSLDEREDLFADHHTLAGRGVSRIDPGQNGLPVLPMTFSIEGMAEAASALVPGKVVVGVRNLRLHRWIPYDPEPTTLEIRASVTGVDEQTGTVEVRADVRDLGNSFVKDGAKKMAAEATLILADQYEGSAGPLNFTLTNEQPCRVSVDELRRNMFHGPIFQMIHGLNRFGDEGIEGELEVRPRSDWFRSNPEPRLALDPALMDAAMHIFGAWHLEQPDWTGRILLPYGVQRIDFFGPPPWVGERLTIRGHNEQASARHFQHGLELLNEAGSLWMRMTGVGYWRFYLPFGHVNFFGPKDEYYLSRMWPEAVPGAAGGTPRKCYSLEPPVDLRQPVLRAAGARVTMTPQELSKFQAWGGTDEELNTWFFGRLLAKDAVRACWSEKYGTATFPADIETEQVDGRIVCRPRGEAGPEPFPPVSVAFAKGRVVAFSAFAERVGVALLAISDGESEADVRSRCARLAVADAFGVPGEELGSPVAGEQGDYFVGLPSGGKTVRVQTAREKEFIVATTLGEVGIP
jgi:malonyl CoA-acyl carrier protein transacylase